MNMLFINPPFGYKEIGGDKENFKGSLNIIPPLGLAYIAAIAEKKGHKVKIIDCFLGLELKSLVIEIINFNPELIGITATTPGFLNAIESTVFLRKILPKAIFICGGPHPTANPKNALETEVFDYLILGEGEETFSELISFIDGKCKVLLENIKGVAFKIKNKIIINQPRPRIENLDSLPLPARHLLPALKDYSPTPASYRKLPLAVIMTSRGCPSYCVFCDRSVFGEKLRKRSVSNIMLEVKEVVDKYGAKEVRFFDDSLTIDSKHVEELCYEMKRIYPSIPWTCLTKVTAVNFDMLKIMRKSGCWQVLFGLESGDDDILKCLGKRNTVDQNKKAVWWAKKAGMSIRGDFLVGSPWETKHSFKKTIEFAKSLPLDFAHFNKFVPYPGTIIYKNLVSKGYHIDFNNGGYINNHNDFLYIPEDFSDTEYEKLLNRAYKEFYLRPGYIFKRLLAMRTFTEFIGNLKGAYSIMSL